jgi:hypothetical protein
MQAAALPAHGVMGLFVRSPCPFTASTFVAPGPHVVARSAYILPFSSYDKVRSPELLFIFQLFKKNSSISR